MTMPNTIYPAAENGKIYLASGGTKGGAPVVISLLLVVKVFM